MHNLPLGKHNPRIVAVRKAIRSDALTPDGLLAVEGPKLLEKPCAVISRYWTSLFVAGLAWRPFPRGARFRTRRCDL